MEEWGGWPPRVAPEGQASRQVKDGGMVNADAMIKKWDEMEHSE